jgi:hypothetical protein
MKIISLLFCLLAIECIAAIPVLNDDDSVFMPNLRHNLVHSLANLASTEQNDVTSVNADQLIPGIGPAVQDGQVLFWNGNGTILYAGTQKNSPAAKYNVTTSLNVPVLMVSLTSFDFLFRLQHAEKSPNSLIPLGSHFPFFFLSFQKSVFIYLFFCLVFSAWPVGCPHSLRWRFVRQPYRGSPSPTTLNIHHANI